MEKKIISADNSHALPYKFSYREKFRGYIVVKTIISLLPGSKRI